LELSEVRKRLVRATAPPTGKSAVLMLLVPDLGGVRVLLTLRSDRLSSHPGELSFPGGRVEPEDASIEAAALRETWEETGIEAHDVQMWGHVFDYTTFRSDRLSLFAGMIESSRIPDPTPPNEEVHRVLLVPVDSLRKARPRGPMHDHPSADLRARRVHPCDVTGYYGLGLREGASVRTIHYWPLMDGHVLWGITADLVAQVLADVYGWTPPSAPRVVDRQEDVLPRRSGVG
jgi:8-oxo-dGTP pyrophosphatase MutT (NUDIX family)